MQLIILAAGLSKRFGKPKQLEEIYNGKTIIDYNINNAIKCGFKDIIVVTNNEIKDEMSLKYSKKAKIVISDASKITKDKKQIGNLYSLYSALHIINDDFIVINADDYYKKSVFRKAKCFLSNNNNNLAIVGYRLKNVLSNNGKVNRGIIDVNKKEVVNITETVVDKNSGLDGNLLVNMGFYIFRSSIINYIKNYTIESIKNKKYLYSELSLTDFIEYIKNYYKIKVIKTNAKWVGLTFYEDKSEVQNFFKDKC